VLSNVSGSALATARATVTIQNDDHATISVDDPSGAELSPVLAFTLTLSNPSASAVTMDVATADGTATKQLDYQPVAETVTFAPGETSKLVTVTIVDDALNEANETFTLGLSNAVGATIAKTTGTATILDDDPMPSLSVSDVSFPEGNSGTTPAVFTIGL
jgi:hypothetical protein